MGITILSHVNIHNYIMNRGMRERERENADSGQKIREIPAIKTKEWAHTVKDEEP